MSRDDATLMDMLLASRSALAFLGGEDLKSFLADAKTQSAILHQLLILGGAIKRLPAEFRRRHPEIPWSDIAGMRDRLIHAYDRVDLHFVWDTCQDKLPGLMAFLARFEPPAPDQRE